MDIISGVVLPYGEYPGSPELRFENDLHIALLSFTALNNLPALIFFLFSNAKWDYNSWF